MKKFLQGFKYAANGITSVIKNEINFRVHIVMALYVLFFAFIGEVSVSEFATLCALIALVLALELINTALEALCDRITREKDAVIGKVKDLCAGAVLISAIFAAIAGLFVFLQEEVLITVFVLFGSSPAILTAFLISIPLALIFIFAIKKPRE